MHARLPETVEVAGVLFDEGVYNVFAIAGATIMRIDDHTRRAAALAAAGLPAS